MKLYNDFCAAYDSGIKKFLRSKTLLKVYVFPAKCAGKKFYTVFTEKEIAELQIKLAGAYGVIGAREGEQAAWQEVQDRLNNPEIRKYDKMVKYINAEKKARRLAEKIRKEENLDEAHKENI